MSDRDDQVLELPACRADVYPVTQDRRSRVDRSRQPDLLDDVERAGSNDRHAPSATASARAFSPWRLAPIALVAAGFVGFFVFDLDRHVSFESLKDNRQALVDWCGDHAILAAATFVAGYALVVAFSLPGAIWMTIAGGFLFGPFLASIYVVIAATLGAAAVFLAARYAVRDALRAKAGPSIRKMEAGFRENALSYLLFLRLVPIFPFWLVNLVPALLGVPLRTFVIGTFFGIVPGTIVYTLVGNGLGAVFDAGGKPDLGLIFAPEILAPIIGLALLSLIPVGYKRLRQRTELPHE